jgi:hypothetical protein
LRQNLSGGQVMAWPAEMSVQRWVPANRKVAPDPSCILR